MSNCLAVLSGLKKKSHLPTYAESNILFTLLSRICIHCPAYMVKVNKWPRLCPCKLVPTYVNKVGGKSFARFCRKIPNIFGRRQDIKVQLMVVNFTFALVWRRKVSTNYIQNFVSQHSSKLWLFFGGKFLEKNHSAVGDRN